MNRNSSIKAFDITRLARQTQEIDVDKIEAVVYAMAEKFLDSVTIEELKEAVGMTRLGQMKLLLRKQVYPWMK